MRYLTSLAAILLIGAEASAEPAPPKVRSAGFVEMVSVQGEACGLLKQWEALSLRALALQDRQNWLAELKAQLVTETADQIEQTDCDSERLTLWIDSSRKGFDSEMLPPYLVAYKTLAGMENPPHVFNASALRLDKQPVLTAIDEKLADLAASGRPAEGGKPWPDYIERTSAAILEFADLLESEGGDQAAAWIAQSARITETWYEEQAK